MTTCECGCEKLTKGGNYLPGHDQKLRSKLEQKVGGLLQLRDYHLRRVFTLDSKPVKSEVDDLDNRHPNAPYTHPVKELSNFSQ